MNEQQLKYLFLSAVILGIIFKKNYNNFYIYQCRKINLDSINDDYFLGSKQLASVREKIDVNNKLVHSDINVMKNIDLFVNSYSKDELLLLRNNIATLKVEKDDKIVELYDGVYDILDNTIIASNSAFNHEMHHMASSLGIVEGVKVIGFMQDKTIDGKSKGIGMGINEGYTEYLSFNQIHNDIIYYGKIVNLIPLIELFFDDKKELRKFYFNADLEALINHFSIICGRQASINLIKDIDKLMFYDSFRTWFDKTDLIELSIRLRLLDYYEKYSGNVNCRELFLSEEVADTLSRIKKLIK